MLKRMGPKWALEKLRFSAGIIKNVEEKFRCLRPWRELLGKK